MTTAPQKVVIRRSAGFLLAVGIVALISNLLITPPERRYILGSLFLIGFCSAVLFHFRHRY